MTTKWDNFVHKAFWTMITGVTGFVIYTGLDMQKSLMEIKVMVSGFSELKADVKELKAVSSNHEVRIQKLEP